MPVSLITRRNLLAGISSAALARGQSSDAPHLGTLYPPVQQIADSSPLDLSFLRPEFKDLKKWQALARKRVFELLSYTPAPVTPDAQITRRIEHEDYIEEHLTFRTTPIFRVPAHLLIPKR